jgi:putative NADH-flavin reductase
LLPPKARTPRSARTVQGLRVPRFFVSATTTLVSGLRQAGVRRFLMLADSLEAAPGLRLVDTPNFPAEWRPISLAHANALEVLKTSDLDWTSVGPAALI